MDHTQIGLTGEFYVLAQLMQRGHVATLTLGNTKGVDILVSNPELNRLFKVEVKTTERGPTREPQFSDEPCYGWPMGVKHERIVDDNLFYCFVVLRGTEHLPRFFVVPSVYVALYVREQHAYWIRSRSKPPNETSMRRFRIMVSDPMGFENNWDLLAGAEVQDSQRIPREPWYRGNNDP